jgi:nucleoside-diphosphate-sugar epimerase
MTQVKPSQYRRINVEGSRRLIANAIAAGVERIVFISTISAFESAKSLYGQSKLEVEKMVTATGGVAIRPGLVWGDRPGGMFGSIRAQIARSSTIPTIGDGRYPQYLVHEDDLAAAVLRAAQGEFASRVLTVANREPWLLRDLVLHLAAQQGKIVQLVGVPWQLIYAALKTAETLGLKLNFRSDSVVSLVYQNTHPEFSSEIAVRPYARP